MKLLRCIRKTNKQSEKGYILMTTFLLISSLSVLSLALFSRGANFMQSSDRNSKRIAAFNMAEAGFDDMFYKVRNSVVTTFPYTGTYTSMNTGSVRGGYQVTVTDMGYGVRKVVATGYSPAQSSTTEPVERRTITGYMQIPSGTSFDYAAFGSEEVTINGNANIDSYNSSNGSYGGTNIGTSGTTGTNSTSAGKLYLEGNSQIKGNLVVGVGGNTNTVISVAGSATYTGSRSSLTTTKSMAVISSSMTSSGALNLNGNTTYTLAAGTYRFSSVKINGNARLVATGAVTMYVDGEITLNGNGVTTSSNRPSNMVIYGTTSAKVTLNGNNSFYGGIYSPLSEFEVNGNATVYGSVIGRDLEINGNARIHYDTTLAGNSSSSNALLSWNEGGLTNQG